LLVWDSQTGDLLVGTCREHADVPISIERPSSIVSSAFMGHILAIESVKFSSDGKFIASGSWDGTVRVWDSKTGFQVSGPFQTGQEILSVVFSPDDKRILAGCGDSKVYIWDLQTGAVAIGPLTGHQDIVTCVVFSSDGQLFASASFDGTVQLWDSNTGAKVAEPFRIQCKINSIAFSPDGRTIASGSVDCLLRLLDSQTGDVIAQFEGHTATVVSVGFSPNGQQILSASRDNTLRVWDLEADVAEAAKPSECHQQQINTLAVSPDGKRIASGSSDGTVRVWDSITGSPIASPFRGQTVDVMCVAFSPDSKRIVSTEDKTVRIWDSESGNILAGPFHGHPFSVFFVAFSPDGTRIVSSCKAELRVWDSNTGAMLSGPFKHHNISCLAMSPDGKQVVSDSLEGHPRVLNLETGVIVTLVQPKTFGDPISIAFSPDGERIISAQDSTVWVWNSKTGAVVCQPLRAAGNTMWVKSGDPTDDTYFEKFERVSFPDPDWSPGSMGLKMPAGITAIGFSGDGKHFVSGSNDLAVRVWSFEPCVQTAGPFVGHTERITSIAFSGDHEQIVSGSSKGTLIVWDRATGAMLAGPLHGDIQGDNSVAFLPDGRRFSPGSTYPTLELWDQAEGTIRVLDRLTDTVLTVLEKREIRAVAFSPDGKRFASGSNDPRLRIWDSVSGSVLAVWEGHTGPIISVSFSHDGCRILSWSLDQTVRVWNSNNGTMLLGPLLVDLHLLTTDSLGTLGFEFSPDDKLIISWGHFESWPVQIWDSESGAVVDQHPFEGHTDLICAVAFSPDGKHIVTGSKDSTICVWDSETGVLAAGPFEEFGSVTSATFSQDSTHVISCASLRENTRIRAWKVCGNSNQLHSRSPFDRFRILIPQAGEIILVSTTVGSSTRRMNGCYGCPLGCARIYVSRGICSSFHCGEPRV
jgi:WD40 repeat protein